jgi:RNA polymerase sigma-70 factor (ECF subfamily)
MQQSENAEVQQMVDHLFRREAGKMVAVLTRLFGFPNMEQAEDIVQDTMIAALETWKFGKIPPNPEAWLYRAAKNKAIDIIRRRQVKHKIDNELTGLLSSEYSLAYTVNELFTENEIKDSQLRMMFACCHPVLSYEAQVTLMLKTLCGLSVHEIAGAFLSNEETVQKRLFRTKEKLREERISLAYPGADAMGERMDAVLKTLYLLFNEGYNSSHPQQLIRADLCEEAMRLAILLTENPKTNLPQTNALLALMCFHASRFDARMDENHFIVLLKDQDRAKWNKFLIEKGNGYLNCSADGDVLHDFHIEAAVASIHSNAPTYEATDWKGVLRLYDLLLHRKYNPVVALNRCIVLGEVEGYAVAIDALKNLKGFEGNRHYNTALGEMYFRSGRAKDAISYFETALALTSSNAEKDLIQKKLANAVKA